MTISIEQPTWLFAAEIAAHLRMSYADVLRALEADLLHGWQRKKRGTWRVHRDEVAAWIEKGCPVPDERRK